MSVKDELVKDLLKIIEDSKSPKTPADPNQIMGMDLINKDMLMQKLCIFINARDTRIFEHAFARAKARYIDKIKGVRDA